jgi:hypothetical protein
MLADSENLHQRQEYSCHTNNLGACMTLMIDTLLDDNMPANGLRSCSMDAIARSVMQEEETKNDDEEKTKNDDGNKELWSVQEEEEKIKR